MKISEEIPQTKDGLLVYIEEAEKEMGKLKPQVSLFKKLKTRIKCCKEKLAKCN